ncbi:hypothetical protein EP837_02628 [Sphingobium sp. EP60837]|nr:hypothetical protein EP837_02628 [Sphingobium sp. EP60837]
MSECSSYQRQSLTCRDGFIQVAKCWNWMPCECGQFKAAYMPHCLRDDLPAHMVAEDGSPPHYRKHKEAGK